MLPARSAAYRRTYLLPFYASVFRVNVWYFCASFYILIEYASWPLYLYRVQLSKPKSLHLKPILFFLSKAKVNKLISFPFSIRPKPPTAFYYIVTGGGTLPQRASASASPQYSVPNTSILWTSALAIHSTILATSAKRLCFARHHLLLGANAYFLLLGRQILLYSNSMSNYRLRYPPEGGILSL